MTKLINTRKREAERTILEDGLLEVIMGVYFLLSGFFLIDRALILNYIWLPVGLVIIDIIRRKYIYPRTGYAKLKTPTKEILLILLATLFGILFISLLVGFMIPSFNILKGGWNSAASYGLAITTTVFLCFLAKRFELPRWYIHGLLFGFAFVLYRSLKTPVVLFVLGVIVFLIGVIVFLDFLHKNPPRNSEIFPSIEDSNAN